MTIGIIGSGAIGSAFARTLARAGLEATISNSRGPNSLKELVRELGPCQHARLGSVQLGHSKKAASFRAMSPLLFLHGRIAFGDATIRQDGVDRVTSDWRVSILSFLLHAAVDYVSFEGSSIWPACSSSNCGIVRLDGGGFDAPGSSGISAMNISGFISVAAGLGLFIIGIRAGRDNMGQLAGRSVRDWLARSTDNYFSSARRMITGALCRNTNAVVILMSRSRPI
jgi:hypothetical protein